MLNSQQRSAPQKNIAHTHKPMQIFFCVAAVPKDSQRFLEMVWQSYGFLVHLTTFKQV